MSLNEEQSSSTGSLPPKPSEDGAESEKSKTETPEVKQAHDDKDSSSAKAKEAPTEAEDDDDTAVTMVDVLKEEKELEDDAAAVLGSADDQHCTYMSGGYVERQALYACLTCTKHKQTEFQPAGICLACSYHCHEGHELVELYTKRNFRCDCGNKKFPSRNICGLEPKKNPENEDNKYNQNFKGLYCTCHRPYPDPEDPIDDEMIQCIVCEDWYHGRHLELEEGKVPKNLVYYEMVCVGCVRMHPFLTAYKGLAVQSVTSAEATEVKVDDEAKNCDTKPEDKPEDKPEGCPVKKLDVDKVKAETLFFREKWRSNLCKCEDCKASYSEREIEFLSKETDTVHHYEAESKKNAKSQYENGMKALSEMDRVKQAEAVASYNSMKTGLMDYLKNFADSKKVVKQEDIKEFFSQMQANKRRRIE